MSITVNNREVAFIENETVKDLLKRMNYTFPMIVVKINGKLIPKEKYPTQIVPNNAKVDAIHLISGG